MKKLKYILIHPILFSLFPTLFLLSKNIGETTINQIVQPLVFSITLTILVWALINFIIQNRKISAASTSILLLMFFSYVHVDRIFVWAHIPVIVYLLFMIGAVLFITIWFVRKKMKLMRITIILNVISFVILIYPLLVITYYEITRVKEIKLSDLSFQEQSRVSEVEKPDIYYIITDSYASNTTLKDYFNFDNSEFTDYLKSKGFYVADKSRANYPFTTPSLASSLNMSYLDDIAKKVGPDSEDVAPLIKQTEDNRVVFYLKLHGYKYYHFGPGLFSTSFNKNADFNYTYQSNPIVISPLTGLLLEQTIMSYIFSSVDCTTNSSLLCIGTLNSRKNHYNYIFDQIGKVGDSVKAEGPKFVFYHNLLTHVPYVFTSSGRYIPRWVELSKKWQENYIAQLEFTNKALRLLIETILKDSKNPPIIILQSDEGPYPDRFRNDTTNFDWRGAKSDELKTKFGILNAYYLPKIDTKILYPEVTPVNTFRIILNEYFGEKLPLLKDINYAQTNYHNPYSIFDVTNSVK